MKRTKTFQREQGRLSALFVVAAATTMIATAFAGTGPVVWFNMEETNSLGQVKNLGSSGSASDLTFAKWDCSLTNEAISGQALYTAGTLNSGARFSCPDMTDRTISFWIRRDVDTGPYTDSSYPNFIAGGPGSGMRIIFGKTSTHSTVYLANGQAGLIYDGNADVLKRHVWEHLAFTFEGVQSGSVKFKCYANGTLIASKTVDLTGVDMGGGGVAKQMVIGGNGGNRPICCCADEFRIWNRTLSDEEVRAEYLRIDRSLIARWQMDAIETDGEDRYVSDVSGRGTDLHVGPGVTMTNDAQKGFVVRTDGTKSTYASATVPVRFADYTLTAWVKQSSDTPYDHIGKIGTPNGGPRYFLGAGDALIFSATLNSGAAILGSNTLFPALAAKDSWSHFALRVKNVWDDAKGKYIHTHSIFMNGVMTTGLVSEVSSLTWQNENSNIYLFNLSTTSNLDRPFEGRSSDVRLYVRPLDDAEIAEIARGPATVSAGADFSVESDTAILRGTVAPHGSAYYVDGFAGMFRWETVSAPDGATPVIHSPESAMTGVTLPAAGAYAFRLVSEADIYAKTSTVTVTRLASPAATPTVSVAASASVTRPLRLHLEGTATGAERVFWCKVSGPGGVWFEPSDSPTTEVTFSAAGSYVLRLTGENGGASATADVTVTATDSEGTVALDAGLKIHWPMDIGHASIERISGASSSLRPDYTNSIFTVGARLHGISSVSNIGYATSDRFLHSLEGSADGTVGGSAFATNQWVSLSMWIYRDSSLTYETCVPYLLSAHQSLGLRFGRLDTGADGFTLQQQGSQGGTANLYFNPPARSVVDRWTHLYALYSREDGEKTNFAFYVDGVKQTSVGSSGFPRQARLANNTIEIGGIKPGRQVGPAMGNVKKGDNGDYYSASFPGTIDDVRIYNRPLTEAEIRTLASRPNLSENLPPVFSIDTPLALDVVARKSVALSLAVFDDGIPTNGTLSCAWQLKSGDGNNVVLLDETDPSTTVRFMKSGMYVLQLVATDGERTSYSPPITANVCPMGTVINIR